MSLEEEKKKSEELVKLLLKDVNKRLDDVREYISSLAIARKETPYPAGWDDWILERLQGIAKVKERIQREDARQIEIANRIAAAERRAVEHAEQEARRAREAEEHQIEQEEREKARIEAIRLADLEREKLRVLAVEEARARGDEELARILAIERARAEKQATIDKAISDMTAMPESTIAEKKAKINAIKELLANEYINKSVNDFLMKQILGK